VNEEKVIELVETIIANGGAFNVVIDAEAVESV
jgi:hypothetical protein